MEGVANSSRRSSPRQNMVTLRTFGNAAEAALAKSVLDDHGISSSLADEASHLYGGAPTAMPVRLLVREDQREEEALRILDTPGPELPEDFEVMNPEQPMAAPAPDVALELRNLQQTVRRIVVVSTVSFFLLWCFIAYLLTDRPIYSERLWSNLASAMRQSDFEKARRIAQTAVKAYPEESWPHEWLAEVDFDRKDFASAEAGYQRAYDLLPSERIRKRLQELRGRAAPAKSNPTSPTPSP
jgi:tetratricopeptide (TPR) repeat protein